MIKVSAKIVSIFVGIAVAGTVTAVAATSSSRADVAPTGSAITSQASSVTSPTTSSTASAKSSLSSAPTTSRGVNNVADGINQIQQATDNGVSQIHDATSKAVSQIQGKQKGNETINAAKAARFKKEIEADKYAVIDPDSGTLVWPDASNYARIKAELGGDAGTVNPDQSSTCQKAKEAARQKFIEKQKAASQAAQKAEQAKDHHQLAANQP